MEEVRDRMGEKIDHKIRDFMKVHMRGGQPCPTLRQIADGAAGEPADHHVLSRLPAGDVAEELTGNVGASLVGAHPEHDDQHGQRLAATSPCMCITDQTGTASCSERVCRGDLAPQVGFPRADLALQNAFPTC